MEVYIMDYFGVEEYTPQIRLNNQPRQMYSDQGRFGQIAQQGVQNINAIRQRAAEEQARQTMAQGAARGQMWQGIGQGIEKGIDTYQQGKKRQAEEERLQRQESREQQQLEMQQRASDISARKAEIEAQYMPEQMEVGLETQRQQLSNQQLVNEGLKRVNDLESQDAIALQLPEAKPGESVAQYKVRMEQQGNKAALDQANAVTKKTIVDLGVAQQLAPHQIDAFVADIDNKKEATRNLVITSRINEMRGNEEQKTMRVNSIAASLRGAAQQGPQAVQAVQASFEGQGVPQSEIAEAHSLNLKNERDAKMQEMYMQSLDPTYKFKLQKLEKADVYSNVVAKIEAYAQNLSTDWINSAQEEQSIVDITDSLRALGKENLASMVESNFFSRLTQGGGLKNRKEIVNDIVRRLKREFEADISSPNDLGQFMGTNQVANTWDQFNRYNLKNKMQSQGSNLFQNAGQIDYRGLKE